MPRPSSSESQPKTSPSLRRTAHRTFAARDDPRAGSPSAKPSTSSGKSSGPPGVGSAQTSSSAKSRVSSWIRQGRSVCALFGSNPSIARHTSLPVLLRRALLAAALVAAFPGVAGAATRVRHGIVYGTGAVAAGTAKLRLDLYLPPSSFPGRRPVAVLIHGGGFRGGDRHTDGLVRIARGLAVEGVA